MKANPYKLPITLLEEFGNIECCMLNWSNLHKFLHAKILIQRLEHLLTVTVDWSMLKDAFKKSKCVRQCIFMFLKIDDDTTFELSNEQYIVTSFRLHS